MDIEALVVNVVVVIVFLELAAYLFSRFFPINPSREFTVFDVSALDRFATFDPELGHVPLPNTRKIDRDITGKEYDVVCIYDGFASRISQFDTSTEVLCSTFGDSFCQCRGVQDHETWQAYLERKKGKRVLNFGVGGYGLDQAYLRYLRNRHHDLGSTIIFAVSPCTIERIVGVYKHYIEFGNYLGVKPRFVEIGDELRLLALPLGSKADLKELGVYKRQIRKLDENFEGYFKRCSPRFPFSYYVLENWKQYFVNAITDIQHRQRSAFFCLYMKKLDSIKRRLIMDLKNAAYRRKNLYFRKLFSEKSNFLVSLVRLCKRACNEDGRSALLMILPDYTNISFINSHGHYYKKVVDRIREEAGVPVFDSYDVFHDCDPQEIFLKDNYSGHHTARGNEVLSEHLARFIQDHDASYVTRDSYE